MANLKFIGSSGLLTVLLTASLSELDGIALAQSKRKEGSSDSEKTTYACHIDSSTGLPTTFAIKLGDENRRGVPVIYWKSTYFSEYTPAARCQIVSKRLQNIQTNQPESLDNITNSKLNGQFVICASLNRSTRQQDCRSSQLLFTLEGEHEVDTILSLFQGTMSGNASGAITRGVPPSEGGKFFVNMNTLVRQGKKVQLGAPL